MIPSFSTSPKPSNNKAKIYATVCFGVSAALCTVAIFLEAYRSIVYLLAVCALVAAIMLYTKYISPKYYYEVIGDGADEPLFVIRMRIGKRDDTLCRVALADVMSARRETLAERRAHTKDRYTALYVYLPTLAPSVSYRVVVNDAHTRTELVLEGTEEFFSELLRLSSLARELRGAPNEEKKRTKWHNKQKTPLYPWYLRCFFGQTDGKVQHLLIFRSQYVKILDGFVGKCPPPNLQNGGVSYENKGYKHDIRRAA